MTKMVLIFSVFLMISCGKISEIKQSEIKNDSVAIVVDSSKIPVPGSDSDTHGCKASAGFTWSELRQKCIRIFEEGSKLSPYQQEKQTVEIAAFVIFEENGNKAELFLPNEKPIILERKSEGDQYLNGEWQLIPWKGYILKKGKEILYTGE